MIPLILSGGIGTRLWPVSRESHPKQFCDLFEESLILKTIRRLSPFGTPWVITTRSLQGQTERLYREQGLPTGQILLEPFGRNTAAAIALACRRLLAEGRGAEVAGVFPADHFVERVDLFRRALEVAEGAAMADRIVTLGITPTFPATGYGYIELSESRPYSLCNARSFREKPERPVAEAFVASGRFVWNAGIFVFRVETMVRQLARYLPGIWEPLVAWDGTDAGLEAVYRKIPSVSIDVGILEQLSDLGCVPCADIGWSDVGSWEEVAKLRSGAPTTEVEAQNCFVFSTDGRKTYALVGVEDLCVVDTPDALLIVKKGASQAVKEVQAALVRQAQPAATRHPRQYYSWGSTEDLQQLPGTLVRVDSGQRWTTAEPGTYLRLRGVATMCVDGRPVTGDSQILAQGSVLEVWNPGIEGVEVLAVPPLGVSAAPPEDHSRLPHKTQ